MSSESGPAGQIARLTSLDRMFLRLETRDWPGHFAGLAVVEARVLQDETGRLRLDDIRERVDRRVRRIPQLRRRLYLPGLFGGGPLWVDEQDFDAANHVHESTVEAPGDDSQLLDAAARLYAPVLDQDRPLWELWFLTGVSDGRMGVLLKLHHSLADGMAALSIMGSLFDLQSDAPEPAPDHWVPEPLPGAWPLIVDNLSTKIDALGGALAALTHPVRLTRRARLRIHVARETLKTANSPRTSLNQVVRPGRLVRFLRLDLGMMKEAAHANNAKVNDVVLDLWAGGLRQLMLHHGDPTAGVELIADIPLALAEGSGSRTVGNELGFMAVPLPVWEPDVERRLDLIASATRRGKAQQQTVAMADFFAAASALPLAKFFAAHQRSVNTRVSNVAGPLVPVHVFGARVFAILPIMRLFGNVGLTLCGFSYAGQLFLVVTADAGAFPDLDVLIAAMEGEWQTLTGRHSIQPDEGATSSVDTFPMGR